MRFQNYGERQRFQPAKFGSVQYGLGGGPRFIVVNDFQVIMKSIPSEKPALLRFQYHGGTKCHLIFF